MSKPAATAQLTGRKPFSSFAVPGADPSVVVGRTPTALDADQLKALEAALKGEEIPGLSADDVLVEKAATKKKS